MAYAIYLGTRRECQVTLPIPKEGVRVSPWPRHWEAGGTSHNACVVLEPGRRKRVGRWPALWLAGARRRRGPWVRVSLEPGEWQACRAQAPWLRKARDACLVTHPEVLRRFLEQESLPIEVFTDEAHPFDALPW